MNSENIKKIENGAAVLFSVCFFAYMFSYISRLPFSALLGSMTADGVIDIKFAGMVTSAYMVCYGAGQLVFGRLVAKMSPTLCMSFGLIGAGLANIGMALSPSRLLYFVLWGFCGICNAMLWPSLTRAFAEWLPDDKKYDAGVKIQLTIPFGSALSLLICSASLKYVQNWKLSFLICGGLVVLSGIISLILFVLIGSYIDERKRMFSENLASVIPDGKTKAPLKIFLTTFAILIPLGAVFNGTLRDAVNAWIPTSISTLFGKDASFAAFITVLVPLSSVFGSYIARAIDKHIKSEMKTSAILFSVCAICGGLLFLLNDFNVYLSIMFMCIIITATLGINTMIVVIFPLRFAKTGGAGAVSGFLNCTCFFASAAASSLYGIAGSALGWRNVFGIWGIVGLTAVIFSVLADKTTKNIKY